MLIEVLVATFVTTVQLEVVFNFPPSGADRFTHCNPTQGSNQALPVIL